MCGLARAASALVEEHVKLPPPFEWAQPLAERFYLMHGNYCLAEAYCHDGVLIFTVAKEHDRGRSFHRFNYADPDFPEQLQAVIDATLAAYCRSVWPPP